MFFQHILLFWTQRLVPEVWMPVVHFFIYSLAVFQNQLAGKRQMSECVQIGASVGSSVTTFYISHSVSALAVDVIDDWCCMQCDSCDLPW